MCEKSGCTFIDDNSFMVKDSSVNFKLFYDRVHLNASDGKLFGLNIKKCIESVSDIQHNNTDEPEIVVIDDSSSNPVNKGFYNGRSTGRRNNNNNYSPQNQNRNTMYRQSWGKRQNRNWSNRYSRPQMMYYPVPPWMMNNSNC